MDANLLYQERIDKCLDFIIQSLQPGVGKRTVAKELFEQWPELFSSIDNARIFIRRMTGAQAGKLHKFQLLRDTFGDYETDDMEIISEPFTIPIVHGKMGIINDVHSLFHDPQSLYLAINYLIQKGVKSLLINGDLLDLYQLSKFTHRRDRARFIQEREWAIRFLKEMQLLFNNVYFKLGNHEKRYQDYMLTHAPLYFELKEFRTLEGILKYDNSTIQFIEHYRRVEFGKLNIYHGHELGGTGAGIVNVARRAFMKGFQNVAVGHHHTVDSFSFKSFDGKIMMAWAIACLCKLNPEYAPMNQWVNGFAQVDIIDDSGLFNFNNKMIIDGHITKS